MKKWLLAISGLALAASTNFSNAQDCTGNRYSQVVFTEIDSIVDVQYGSNLLQDGTTNQDLLLDIYFPKNDTDTDRPVVLLAHGGSFIGGNRKGIADLCKNISKLGYVTVSMSYRLLSITDPSVFANVGLAFKKEVVRSVHDMKAAVRFLRKSYDDGNTYGINPNIIIVGGVSAGAILANHAVYLDTEAKIPSELASYFTDQGGLEGNSGNAGYNSKAQMVLSMCGAIMDTTFMESGDQPFYGVHTLNDATVPNLYGQPNIGMSIPVDLYGDSLMFLRARNQGMSTKYKSYAVGGHCEFGTDYFADMMGFTYQNLCSGSLNTNNLSDKIKYSVYPNPASNSITLDMPGNNNESTVQIIDMVGKVIYSQIVPAQQVITSITVSQLPAGIYNFAVKSSDGKSTIKKIVIE